MHTLHEYMVITKSQEYLLAVGAMIIFCLFWWFVAPRRQPDRQETKA